MVENLSSTSLQVKVVDNKGELGSATGFIIYHTGKLYFVTNWHVVTGRNQESGNSESEVPNKLKVEYINKKNNQVYNLELSLYKNDDMSPENKIWLEYPQNIDGLKQPDVDVVLVPIAENLNKDEIPIFELDKFNNDITIMPALPVSIIGFPFNKSYNNKAIWITGFIASEPSIDQKGLPLIYINATGYSGLSGSPVISRNVASYISVADGRTKIKPGIHDKFIGVYSGRMYDQKKDILPICNVWKAEVIDLILKANVEK